MLQFKPFAAVFVATIFSQIVFATESDRISEETIENYRALIETEISPVSYSYEKGLLIYSEKTEIEGSVHFRFEDGYVVYTVDCQEIFLNIKDMQLQANQIDAESPDVLEIAFKKNSALKAAYSKMLLFYSSSGLLDSIKFGNTVYYL